MPNTVDVLRCIVPTKNPQVTLSRFVRLQFLDRVMTAWLTPFGSLNRCVYHSDFGGIITTRPTLGTVLIELILV